MKKFRRQKKEEVSYCGLCFSHSNSLSSKLIRWWTKSLISHCVIVYYDFTLNMKMVLSAESKFILIPYETWIKKNTIITEVELMDPTITKSLHWVAKRYLDTGYDWGAFWSEALRTKCKYLWNNCKVFLNKLVSSKKLICSESIIRFLQYAGYITARNLHPEFSSQKDIMREVLAGPKSEIKIIKQP